MRKLGHSVRTGAAIACATVLLVACSAPTPVPSPSPGTAEQPPAPVAPTDESPPQGPTSGDLIDQAYLAGDLDLDSALAYKVYAEFMPERLPPDLRGDDSTLDASHGAALLSAVQDRLPEMAPELRADLEPFLRRPDDPTSFWGHGVPREHLVGQSPIAAIGQVQGQAQEDDNGLVWRHVDAAASPIRVWYWELGPSVAQDDGSDPEWAQELGRLREQSVGSAALAAKVAAEFDASNMWSTEREAMLGHEPCSDGTLISDGGDPRLDVYLVTTGIWAMRTEDGNTLREDAIEGAAIPLSDGDGCHKIPFILLRQTLGWDQMRSVMAHELFHAFQFSFSPFRRSRTLSDGKVVHQDFQYTFDFEWWHESSATWAEDLVYPTMNVEHRQLWCWFRKDAPNGPLDYTWCRYSAYQWPFYLTRLAGESPSLIGEIWQAAEEQTPLQVMGAMADWEERFKEFNLWNWNQPPVERYLDPGQNAPGSGKIERIRQTPVPVGVDITGAGNIDVELERTAARYYEVTVDDSKGEVGWVEFDLAAITDQPHAGVQAIVTIGDPQNPTRRYTEDWSTEGRKEFCRLEEDERVTNVVLVVSNGSVEDGRDLKGAIPIEPRESCPQLFDVTFTFDSTSHLHESHYVVTGTLEPYVEGMPLDAEQPIDDYVGTGTITGQAVDGITMSLTYVRPPRCERDQLWVNADGDVYLTGTFVPEGWPGMEGPVMLVGIFPKDATNMAFGLGLGGTAPTSGGTITTEYVRAEEAECDDRWVETSTMTVTPRGPSE